VGHHLNKKIRVAITEIAKQGPTEWRSLQEWAEIVGKKVAHIYGNRSSILRWGIRNRTLGKLLGENPHYKKTTIRESVSNITTTWYQVVELKDNFKKTFTL